MKKYKHIIIIISLLITILIMSVAYSSFITKLSLYGTTEIIYRWNVRITSITASYISENCDAGDLKFSKTQVTLNAHLVKPGDYITYLIIIENLGTVDAVLNKISYIPDENPSPFITYETTEPHESLNAGEITFIMIKISFDENATEIPPNTSKSITCIIDYTEK